MAEADSTSTSADPAPPKGGLRLRTRLLWVLSVVVAATVAAGVTYAITSMAPVSVSSGAEQIATLEPDTLVDVPAGWFGAGLSLAAYEYYGLTLFEAAGGSAPPETEPTASRSSRRTSCPPTTPTRTPGR